MASDFTIMRKKQIGEFVKKARLAKGMNRTAFGHMIGYDGRCDNYVASFETGRTYIPPEKIRAVKEVLGCDYEDLIP